MKCRQIMDFLEDRVGDDGRRINAIRRWIDDQEKPGRVAIDAQLGYLETVREWTYRDIKKRKGTEAIYELIINTRDVHYRPLGFYGPKQGQFTITLGAKEQNSKLPKSADASAERNREIALRDGGRIREHEYRKK